MMARERPPLRHRDRRSGVEGDHQMSDETQGLPTLYRLAWQSKITGVESVGPWTSDLALLQWTREAVFEGNKDADFWIEHTNEPVDPTTRVPGE